MGIETASQSNRSKLLTSWNRQWDEMADQPRSEIASWASSFESFEGCRTARQVFARCKANSDAGMIALVELAQSGQTLAGTIALHRMMPILVVQAGRDSRLSLDDLCSTAWVVLMRHNLSRKFSVLATLCLDTRRMLLRYLDKTSREVPFDEIPVAVFPFWRTTPKSYSRSEHLLDVAADLDLLTPATEPVLRSVYVDGLSGREAALRHGISETAARYRCSAGVKRLRERSEALKEQLIA